MINVECRVKTLKNAGTINEEYGDELVVKNHPKGMGKVVLCFGGNEIVVKEDDINTAVSNCARTSYHTCF